VIERGADPCHGAGITVLKSKLQLLEHSKPLIRRHQGLLAERANEPLSSENRAILPAR